MVSNNTIDGSGMYWRTDRYGIYLRGDNHTLVDNDVRMLPYCIVVIGDDSKIVGCTVQVFKNTIQEYYGYGIVLNSDSGDYRTNCSIIDCQVSLTMYAI